MSALALVLGVAPLAAQTAVTPQVAPAATSATLAPDGIRVAAVARDGSSVRLLAVSPYETSPTPTWLTPAGADVADAAWTPDGAGLVYTLETDGHIYYMSADGASGPRDLTPQAAAPARLAGFAPGAALVEVAEFAGGFPSLYAVPLAGGAATLVQPSAPGVVRWLVDGGVVRLGLRELEPGDREIVRVRAGALVPVFACTGVAACEPVGFHPDGRVWVRSSETGSALLLLDPISLQTEVARAELGADPRAVFREDSTYASALAGLQALLPGAAIEFLEEPRGGGGRMLVAGRAAAGATLYVFDRWAGTVTPVLPLAEAGVAAAGLQPDPSLTWPERLVYRISDGGPGLGSASPPTEVRRRIRRATEDGRPVLIVLDEAEVPVFEPIQLDTTRFQDPTFDPAAELSSQGTSMEDASDEVRLDAATLRPLRRRASGPLDMELEFEAGGVTGVMELGGFATRVGASAPEPGGAIWTDGAALELLVAALPLGEGFMTALTYFDTGAQALVTADLAVRGAARADTEAGAFDAWTLTLSPRGGAAASQTWLVRRTAPHLLLRSTLRTRDFTRVVELMEPPSGEVVP